LPDLAGSLNNLAVQQAQVGDRDAALATITEAAGHYRRLAEANPAAHLPDLAISLNNLANQQAEAGDRDAALATITEAAGHYRRLAEANPAAHLPNLAATLNNLANRQAEVGDRGAALATITEAVGHYRRLAEANPAAHLPNLAATLNTLAVRQAEAGDRRAARATITEAVGIRRRLAEANPAAHLPDLAMSLNNLAIRQAEVGDRSAALATITEAVGHYRRLAEDNPAAHLPDLAGSLNNLAVQQAQAGNRRAARATITEAVGIRRRLAEANPAAHLPDLAGSLNNLAVQQAQVGDRDAALATITEATGIRRRLAEANPAAHLPNLAMSLNTLANQQAQAGDQDAALEVWEGVWEGLTSSAVAFLRAERYLWRRRSGEDSPTAIKDLVRAAQDADRNDSDLRFSGEIRRRIRQLLDASDAVEDRVPPWATLSIDDHVIELANSWVTADTSAEVRFLRTQWSELCTEPIRAALSALGRLYPDNPELSRMNRIIDHGINRGIDETLVVLSAEVRARELVQDWIKTPTWTTSQRFLEQRDALRTDPAVRALLTASDDATARQHLGILQLTDHYRTGEVFDAVLDYNDAKDLLFELITTGDPELLRALWWASPHLSRDEFTAPFIVAVLAAFTSDGELPDYILDAAHTAAAASSLRDRERAVRALDSIHVQHRAAEAITAALRAPHTDGG
ncbi:hypothetical protein ACIRRA_45695, partial [Nocardia sp. NPDC101769]